MNTPGRGVPVRKPSEGHGGVTRGAFRPILAAMDLLPDVLGESNRTARLAARLIDTLESGELFPSLHEELSGIVPHNNFIVYWYRQGFAADLVFSNLDMERLRGQMAPYISGLYLLDPFYIADMSDHRQGLLRLDHVAPEAFHETEFYLTFYKSVQVLDEMHFVVPLALGRSVHVFLEREAPHERFADAEFDRLAALAPLVASAIQRHWSWRERSLVESSASPIHSAGGIEGVIRNMRPGQLTPREVEVIALLLRGQSSKRIAHQLGISEGTVTNHKRNVYDKLGVHSQAQLFSMFLGTLTGDGAPA